MKMLGCSLRCECGGVVESLSEQVLYILTENHTVIFRGVCSECCEITQVERDIMSLLLMCPNEDKKGN